MAVQRGHVRLEIAEQIARYHATSYAPNVAVALVLAHRAAGTGASIVAKTGASTTTLLSPFVFLSQLDEDTLRLVARFAASLPRRILEDLAEARRQALLMAGMGQEAANQAGGGTGSRFDFFNPVRSFDPRSRSLPYLLRQAEENDPNRRDIPATTPASNSTEISETNARAEADSMVVSMNERSSTMGDGTASAFDMTADVNFHAFEDEKNRR